MKERFLTAFKSVLLWFVLIPILDLPSGGDAVFEGCDKSYDIRAGLTYLESPFFPQNYRSGSSCRYKFIAPMNFAIKINCSIVIPKGANGCKSETFYVSTDGDTQLRGSEQFCGRTRVVRKSAFRSIVLAYISKGNNGARGRFRCSLFAARQPCDCGWSADTRILNGQDASPNEFPSMVALHARGSDIDAFCGGTILNHRYIVTAAHCTRTQPVASNIEARVGDITLEGTPSRYSAAYRIQRIIEHPNYKADPVRNDIALLQTTQPIEWSRGVGPVCLPPVTQNSNNFDYKKVEIIGWGTTSAGGTRPNTLQKVSLQVATNARCKNIYNGTSPIYPSEICTYDSTGSSRDSCQFDSGGPVLVSGKRQTIVGIISFGKSCGEGGYAMGVNTRITSFSQWLRKYVKVCNKPLG